MVIEIQKLLWEESTITHIARHDVTPAEVEEVCAGAPIVAEGYSGRLRLIGPTRTQRMLAVILAPKGEGVYYPVTARPASRKERRMYVEEREGGEKVA